MAVGSHPAGRTRYSVVAHKDWIAAGRKGSIAAGRTNWTVAERKDWAAAGHKDCPMVVVENMDCQIAHKGCQPAGCSDYSGHSHTDYYPRTAAKTRLVSVSSIAIAGPKSPQVSDE